MHILKLKTAAGAERKREEAPDEVDLIENVAFIITGTN